LAVGAVQTNRTYANFSSIGPTFDGRVKPDIMAQGQNSVLSDTNGSIVTANGTSFSCPIMAGMIASFWQAVPNLNAQQIVNFVRQASDRYTFPDSQYGYGIPNFQQALNTALNINDLSISDFQIQQIRSNNSLRIVFPNNFKNVTLALYNTIGQQVLPATPIISHQNIDLGALSTGVYLYKIDSDRTTKTGKIIN
jgi:subtilisin family serine protease